MNNFFEQLKKEGQRIRMSDAEKARIRANLYASMHIPKPTSPYFSYFTISALLNLRAAVAFVLVFVLVGSSSAYAAEGALPGDVLYPIKVSVNETVALVLANTPEKKLETEARLAARRIAEAKMLDAEGRLDVATAEEIEKNFDIHAERALALADAVVPPEVPVADTAAFVQENGNEDTVRIAAELAPESTVTLSIVQEVPEDVSTSTATTTVTVRVENKGSEIRMSLESQKELFKELRKRAESRDRGEIKGASAEHRKDDGAEEQQEND